MFTPQLCVDAVFEEFGIAAVLDPDGAADDVLVLPSQEDQELSFGQTEIIDAGGVFEIRAGDFAGYSVGAILEVAGERRKVKSHRVRDKRRLKVVLSTAPST